MRLVLAFAALVAALPAHAGCNWEWMCSGEGACKQMPLCDSVYDVPGPRPESAPPAPPPIAPRPFGTGNHLTGLTCEPVMRQSMSGHWSWAEVCFCSDEMKAADPTRPLSNIVRCKAPWNEPEQKAEPQAAPAGRSPA